MGKKKQQKEVKTVSKPEEKVSKKTYSLAASKQEGTPSVSDGLQKVTIPAGLERELLALIQSANQERTLDKEVSGRLTQKKLVDIYGSLSSAGFNHKQIEQAMENTILHGGDLIDALDWLCLNTQNDKLPENFSQTLQQEEVKKRPTFDTTLQEPPVTAINRPKTPSNPDQPKQQSKPKRVSPKAWILQYMEQESDSDPVSIDSDDDEEQDPNSRYLTLTALLLDAKEAASESKKAGDKAKVKEISKKIRDYATEMKTLEKHPDFNKLIKLRDMESSKTEPASATQGDSNLLDQVDPSSEPANQKTSNSKTANQDQGDTTSSNQNPLQKSRKQSHDKNSDEEEDLGFGMFAQAEAEPPKADKVVKVDMKVRNFEYTRQQWTGKSPKQFLIDWVRKHLSKSPPPKFEKKPSKGNTFRCIVRVNRQKEGMLELTPDILCGNVKEAEHLSATLALYHLCKGQSVYQLLPPPYRDVWLEWSDAEKLAQQQDAFKENKPRDQFLAKLLAKVQGSLKGDKGQRSKVTKAEDEVADSWENMDWDEEELPTKTSAMSLQDGNKKPLVSDKVLRDTYESNQQTQLYAELLKTREQLPVYQHRREITECLQKHRVMLIAGETGSGKSTQVPHFLLEECILGGEGGCNIICTQPRRISATSLAQRVSQEMGEGKLGGRDSLCGYQIRFESCCGPKTRLTYCTTGVLLRKLQLDPQLKSVSHIIVDEVHERNVQSDFLLIILQQLLVSRSDLRVVLMSATLDADKFSSYFQHCPVINIPGRTFPVQVYHVEDAVEQTGFVLDEDSPYALRQAELIQEDHASVTVTEKGGNQAQLNLAWTKDDISKIDQTSLSADKYSLKTRNTVTRMNMRRINMDLIVELLLHIESCPDYGSMDGAVLVFLPGLSDITELYEILTSDRRFTNNNKYKVVALHSVLSSADQSQAFKVPPAGIRKVVIATNIAETGITIPDVVFVIDAGKVKENRYMESSQMNALQEVFISKANAKQRQGRAGRVREGVCFRLYTKHMYDAMRPFTVPELLRVPLEELCLHIMKCNYGKPELFLACALDPPQSSVVNRAMSLLASLGACLEGETLTPLGHHLAALPVHVRIGKMLLYSAVMGCIEPVAVIAASMSDKSPFVVPVGKQDLVTAARQAMAVGASDQLTVYKAYLGWCEARSKGRSAEMKYCQQNFLKRNTLLEIDNVKNDLIKLLATIGFDTISKSDGSFPDPDLVKDGVLQISKHRNTVELTPKVIAKVKAILTAGLYPSVAKVTYEAPVDVAVNPEQKVCVGETPQGPAHVHPSSVNRHLQANGWLVFHEKVKSTRVYLRDCTLVSAYPLLLFGGEIDVQHTDQLLTVDSRIRYKAFARTGVIFKELRRLLDDLLARKLDNPALKITDDALVGLMEELLYSEKTR